MNITKFSFVGAIAVVSALSVNLAHAGDCKMAPGDTVGLMSIDHAADNQSKGKFFDGSLCVHAIAKGMTTFDENIDKIINNKLVSAAFDSMKDDVKTNIEAKKLQDMYREEKTKFVNDYLVTTQQDNYPTKSGGRRLEQSQADEKMDSYLEEKKPFDGDKIKEMREKFITQAKVYISNSIK